MSDTGEEVAQDELVDAEIVEQTDTDDERPSWGHDRLVWIDVETTGLDWRDMGLLEIGVMVTGPAPSFTEVASKSWLIQPRTVYRGEVLRADVFPAHLDSGLWTEALDNGVPHQVALCQMEGWLAREHTERMIYGGPMCGASVHFDRKVLEQFTSILYDPARALSERGDAGFFAGESHMSGLVDRIWSYRNFDVSSLREFVSQICGAAAVDRVVGTDEPPHLALFDLQRSVEMARRLVGMISEIYES